MLELYSLRRWEVWGRCGGEHGMLLYLYFHLGSRSFEGLSCLRRRMCWGRFVCTSSISPSHSRRGTYRTLGAVRGSFLGDTYPQMLRGGDRFLGSRVSGIGIVGGSAGFGGLRCCGGGAGW